jgi:hypothetical protein
MNDFIVYLHGSGSKKLVTREVLVVDLICRILSKYLLSRYQMDDIDRKIFTTINLANNVKAFYSIENDIVHEKKNPDDHPRTKSRKKQEMMI